MSIIDEAKQLFSHHAENFEGRLKEIEVNIAAMRELSEAQVKEDQYLFVNKTTIFPTATALGVVEMSAPKPGTAWEVRTLSASLFDVTIPTANTDISIGVAVCYNIVAPQNLIEFIPASNPNTGSNLLSSNTKFYVASGQHVIVDFSVFGTQTSPDAFDAIQATVGMQVRQFTLPPSKPTIDGGN